MREEKKKRLNKYHKGLTLFAGLDSKNFHPTLDFRVVKDESGEHVIGILQKHREAGGDGEVWREVEVFDPFDQEKYEGNNE